MAYQFSPDVEELVRDRMASGNYESEEDVLRDALEALRLEDEELRAIEEALDDVENGDQGIPLDEAFASLRAKFNIPADAEP